MSSVTVRPLADVVEAAAFLRRSRNSIYIDCREGKILHYKVGNSLRFDLDELRCGSNPTGVVRRWPPMGSPDKARDPAADRTPSATTTNQATSRIARRADSVDEALAEIRRWERAARVVTDDRALSIRQKCKALLEMMARARRSENAPFLETAIRRGCRHLFEGNHQAPRDVIEANRRLIRRGHDTCPECRRPLPSVADLDRWREFGHDYRRSA